MRKRIIIAFCLIFALFIAGSGIMISNLVSSTDKLRYLIGLHEIEDIRQDLFSSVQRVSAYIFGSPEIFADHLDEIISNTKKMQEAVRRCDDCHHVPKVRAQLVETARMIDSFEEQLSYLITIVADKQRRHDKQEEVYRDSTNILNKVQGMVNSAAKTIEKKKELAIKELERVYILVAVTLLATIILSLIIAQYLTRSITRPINALLDSTRNITEGQWGYQTDYHAADEFQELIDAFNSMSKTLAQKRELEQRHLEELRRTQQQLIEAEKLTALGTMAGGIAHDFNNILCGMIGHLNILARQIPPDEEHRKIIDTIEQAGFRAAELVKQLLTFARQKPMAIIPLDLNKRVDDSLLRITDTLGPRIKIQRDLAENLPLVQADSTQLEQVIINLCVNARDAMPEGGTITIGTDTASLDDQFCASHRDARPGPYVILTVRDTGVGINGKILPRVFDPFFTTKEVGKGSGLGLAMVYGIVKSHDGFCTIESKPGQGTIFQVYLPAVETGSEEPGPPQDQISLEGRTILLVDDEFLVTSMLSDFLEDQGCKTLVARNGREAIDIFLKSGNQIDLVVLDIIMPVMNGKETYRELVKIKPDVRVLVSSGYVVNSETQEILNLGAQGFLQKPYRMEDVLQKISRILGKEE